VFLLQLFGLSNAAILLFLHHAGVQVPAQSGRLAPPNLADELLPLESIPGRRRLRSASNMELFIPRTRTASFGPRVFAVCGPTIWNSLPSELRDQDLTVCVFARKLKTFLFV
jgi:hypothetical protein